MPELRVAHVLSSLWDEIKAFRPRLFLAGVVMAVMPDFVGLRVRVRLLRFAGVRIGTGSTIWGRVSLVVPTTRRATFGSVITVGSMVAAFPIRSP